MAITFYKERPADSLTIALWDYLTDPVYAEGGDTKQAGAPSADPGNATEWGLNNQFREIADKLCELAVFGDIISISTQLDFEKYFGKSYGDVTCQWHDVGLGYAKIPANTIIFLSPIAGNIRDSLVSPGDGWGDDGTNSYNSRPAFVLKNRIALSDNVVIKGFNENDVVVIRDDSDDTNEDNIKFCSDYKAQSAISGVTDNDFTVADSSGFIVGDLVCHDENGDFYRIISIPDGTSILVDRNITGAASTNLQSMVTGVKMEGWSYDGRGGVDGLGGTVDSLLISGGAFETYWLGESELNCKIINFKITGQIGSPPVICSAIYGIWSFKIKAEKIYHCMATPSTFGQFTVAGLFYSKIRMYYCSGYSSGPGAFGCWYSDIEAYYNQALYLGASVAYNCFYSKIKGYKCIGAFCARECDYSKIRGYKCTGTDMVVAFMTDYADIKAFECTGIANVCHNCDSIWGDSGAITNSSLGGVRLVGDDTAGGDTYTSNPTNTGGYTNAVS
jgi:hypothetical protein